MDAQFWETGYGKQLQLTAAQRAQVDQFVAGKPGKVEVTAVAGSMTFHLYADTELAAIANQKKEQPVEGIDFDVTSLRDKPQTPEAFPSPGLIVVDTHFPAFAWAPGSESPVRIATFSNTDFSKINSVAWVALAFNPNLSPEQVISQRILAMTTTDAQGNTVHLLFA